MQIIGRWVTATIIVLVSTSTGAQQPTQSADTRQPRAIVEEAVHTELAADAADHSLWLYYETDKKPGDGMVQWAAQTRMGEVDRVLQQDGRRLTDSDQRSRMDRFIHDPAAQARQRRGGDRDDKRAAEMLNMLPDAFIWTKEKQDGATTWLHFRPNPAFHAPGLEMRVFAAMEGELAVDDTEHRIASLRGKLTSEVKFGWGILGEMEPGGTFDVERRALGHGVWQITETHVHIQGHAVLFHTISDQEDDVKTKFEELPANISLNDAEKKLMEKQ